MITVGEFRMKEAENCVIIDTKWPSMGLPIFLSRFDFDESEPAGNGRRFGLQRKWRVCT